MRLPFALVDVFTTEPFNGNPLAVVLGGPGLQLEDTQRIAREFNQSETTIVLPPTSERAHWRLRSFTNNGVEIFGAGHNALGAWWWLAERGTVPITSARNTYFQEIGRSVLPLQIYAESGRPTHIVMTQDAPVAGARPRDLSRLADVLGLEITDLATNRVPAQVMSTGDTHLMLPLIDRDAVDRTRPNAARLFPILQDLQCEGCYVFSLEPAGSAVHAYARFLNPTDGLWEDAASGGAAGPLACHLHAHALVEIGEDFLVEQGTAMGRPSLIRVQVTESAVQVAASCFTVAEGVVRL